VSSSFRSFASMPRGTFSSYEEYVGMTNAFIKIGPLTKLLML